MNTTTYKLVNNTAKHFLKNADKGIVANVVQTKTKEKIMADLRCPNCQDNLGKDRENPRDAYCGYCDTSGIINPRGYTDDEDDES